MWQFILVAKHKVYFTELHLPSPHHQLYCIFLPTLSFATSPHSAPLLMTLCKNIILSITQLQKGPSRALLFPVAKPEFALYFVAKSTFLHGSIACEGQLPSSIAGLCNIFPIILDDSINLQINFLCSLFSFQHGLKQKLKSKYKHDNNANQM